jgi:hypothetical protein
MTEVQLRAGAMMEFFSLHHWIQTSNGYHPTTYPMGARTSYPVGGKRPGNKADHSTPSIVEDKNSWIYTSTPPIRLHGVVLN